jgi:hypothetical protein
MCSLRNVSPKTHDPWTRKGHIAVEIVIAQRARMIEPHMHFTPSNGVPQVAITLDACMGETDIHACEYPAAAQRLQFEALKQHDDLEKLRAGKLDTKTKQKKLLAAYAQELSMKRLEWANIQVSVAARACNHHCLRPPSPLFPMPLQSAITPELTP